MFYGTLRGGQILAKRGAITGEKSSSDVSQSASCPGSQAWCHQWNARVQYFKRNNAERVRVSLDGGISAEGPNLEEAAQYCHERLMRRASNLGPRVLRTVARG